MGADFLIVCMAERVRESNSKSRTIAKRSPPPAVVPIGRRKTPVLQTGFGTILEFEFLSRIIASMQSMSGCRHNWRLFLICRERARPSPRRAGGIREAPTLSLSLPEP
jgi:hypothetical protein